MNISKALLYALGFAAVAHTRQRVKKRKLTSAAKGAALGYLLVTQVAPRVNLSLPAPRGIV